ncbi:hypothetical protein DE146DRAFT_454513 [Phaeosphaeria sp. MPI-PUGE-AT-0046c]|nr:hypothetical protein DE146DRAFT_454513 [Phaeosphaeria sp. MPI-PUGE-AT-0046c]
MAVLDNILPAVGRISGLSRELYRVAAANHKAAQDLIKAASTVNGFASTLKQIGTIITEDDRLPSQEAFEVLEDLIEQSLVIESEIQSLVNFIDQEHEAASFDHDSSPTRLAYLSNHLEALRATLSVLLQTLNTAQSIVWSKYRPTVSQQQAAKAVANERLQLETLITEQQLAILTAAGTHTQTSLGGTFLLTEEDSSQSLVSTDQQDGSSPATLHQYQDRYIASLDQTSSSASQWLLAIRNITTSQSDRLLDRWTCLPQLNAQLREAEQQSRTQQRESQQPMVESEDEEDHANGQRHTTKSKVAPHTMQPLFMETESNPIPPQEATYGPTAPISPAASPRNSRHSLAGSLNDSSSPRSSITSLPMEAAAAVEAHEEDEDIDLEIPWQLCTRKYYWAYIDGKVVSSNTDQLPSIAFLERNSWTEIMASWVCKEAIHERGYRATQVQKERQDGRRTRLTTTFIIEHPLQFEEVKRLVERTVDIYRQNRPPSPPPRVRRSSFQRPPPPPVKISRPSEIDRDRTPVPSKTHPPIGVHRPTSSMPIPPQMPPLDRSMSMPGPGFHRGHPHAPNLQIPMPPGPLPSSMPHGPYSPQLYNSPQGMYPPRPASPGIPSHLQPHGVGSQQSPLRQSYLRPNSRGKHGGNVTTSEDSESDRDRRRRRSKSRNRSSYGADAKKKSHNKKKAAGVLMGVGGLTALLDGLSGL